MPAIGLEEVAMRLRFSLRLLLVLITVIAIGLGVWFPWIGGIKEQVRLHKEALAKIYGSQPPPPAAPLESPTIYESFVRRFIDGDAFARPPDAILGYPGHKHREVIDLMGRPRSKDAEAALDIARDLYGIPNILICVDKFTIAQARSISPQTKLKSLYIDCLELEPGATRELAKLSHLESFAMPGAVDDDAMLLLRRHPRLKSILLNCEKLNASAAQDLVRQKQLEAAILIRARAGSPFLSALSGHPNLIKLELFDCDCNSDDVKVLASLPKLQVVDIDGSGSLAAGAWKNLAQAQDLRTVDVTLDTRPSAEGVDSLTKCKKLEVLNLEAVILNAEQFQAFAGHPSLKQIRFRGKFPDSEIETFLRSTPNCYVGMYKPDSEGYGPGKTGMGLRGKFYRLREGKLDLSTSGFMEMVRP
jgi:hypothetical protein